MQILVQQLNRRAQRLLSQTTPGSGMPDAEDLVQGTLLRLRESNTGRRLLGGAVEDCLPFALSVLRNHFVDSCLRKQRPYLRIDGSPIDEVDDQTPEDFAIRQQEHRQRVASLKAATADLSEQERLFLLACLTEGSASGAQRVTGWPPGGASNASFKRNQLLLALKRRVQQAKQTPHVDTEAS